MHFGRGGSLHSTCNVLQRRRSHKTLHFGVGRVGLGGRGHGPTVAAADARVVRWVSRLARGFVTGDALTPVVRGVAGSAPGGFGLAGLGFRRGPRFALLLEAAA